MSGKYDDILHLPHPTSVRHPRMPISERASIFSPFAALTGHAGAIAETARQKLAQHGINCTGKTARQLRNHDYDQYDLLIGMDRENLHNMYHICGGDFDGKMHLLMEYAGRPDQEVADPWYTDDFEATWRDVLAGCQGLLKRLIVEGEK